MKKLFALAVFLFVSAVSAETNFNVDSVTLSQIVEQAFIEGYRQATRELTSPKERYFSAGYQASASFSGIGGFVEVGRIRGNKYLAGIWVSARMLSILSFLGVDGYSL